MEFELDYKSIEFQQQFYNKYIYLKHSDYYKEEDKAEHLQINIQLSNGQSVLVTKNYMNS